MSAFLLCRGDARALPFADKSVHCCVTSPPYFGLRDYGVAGQLGLEKTPDEYVARMVAVFREVRRCLRDDGTLWLNIGDSYNSIGHPKSSSGYGTTGLAGGKAQEHTPLRRESGWRGAKHKDLIGIPWMLAFALRADGWYLRSDIIWHKPNPMPESVTDRPTKAHEYIFLLSKSERYYYDHEAIQEESVGSWNSARSTLAANGVKNVILNQTGQRRTAGADTFHRDEDRTGRNKRTVWSVTTQPYSEAHFATYPPALIEPCILAGSPIGGIVLDPFTGSGTTGEVAIRHGRHFVGVELNQEYIGIARKRIGNAPLSLFGMEAALGG